MPESKAPIGILFVDIFIPSSGSLKSKRMILKSLKDRMGSRFNISVAEIDYLDKWQRSVFGICMIAADKRYLDSSLQGVLSFLQEIRSIEISQHWIEFL